MSDNPEECIVSMKTGDTIMAKETARYVGQHIGSDGRPRIKISERMVGKIINLLQNFKGMTRRARIRIFKVFIRAWLTT